MNFTILQGDNRETLKTIADNSIDAIITDPPYGIDFLGKSWDANTGALETYTECLRVLKPGGHILAFSAARTYHHLAVTLEQAGFEIRDQIMWIYSSGFPKAQDIGKAIQKRIGVEETKPQSGTNAYANQKPLMERMSFANLKAEDYPPKNEETVCTSPEAQHWSGWKTALKPAHEPICMARKPFKGSTIDNVLAHGVGALNIDATRIGYKNNDKEKLEKWANKWNSGESKTEGFDVYGNSKHEVNEQGRFPSNVIGEVAGYQKFFYCPKVSRKERHVGFEQKNIPTNSDGMLSYDENGNKKHKGKNYAQIKEGNLDHIPAPFVDGERMAAKHQKLQGELPKNKDFMVEAMGGEWIDNNRIRLPHKGEIYVHGLKHEYELWCKANNVTPPNVGNNHPTVKPVELMKYLIKLVTPPNSVVLDPFNGSGSTGMAAVELGHRYIGCELDPNYVKIAETRIRAWNTAEPTGTTFEELFE